MSEERLTEVSEVQKYMGSEADNGNILIATQCSIFDAEGNEAPYITEATKLQMEGFIIQPRHLRHYAFEVITEDPDEAHYLFGLVRTSQHGIAEQQAEALVLSRGTQPYYAGQPKERDTYQTLGAHVEKEKAE